MRAIGVRLACFSVEGLGQQELLAEVGAYCTYRLRLKAITDGTLIGKASVGTLRLAL